MRSVVLPTALADEMKVHALAAYPDECCGFLIGRFSDTDGETERTIFALERARNEFRGERRRRFLILPEELREVERRREGSAEAVVGFYHSHPDHPARPSQYDQDHAWPWYSYLVIAVTAGEADGLGAFELDPDSSTFREVPLRLVAEPARPATVVGG